jgi:hypothetical protein
MMPVFSTTIRKRLLKTLWALQACHLLQRWRCSSTYAENSDTDGILPSLEFLDYNSHYSGGSESSTLLQTPLRMEGLQFNFNHSHSSVQALRMRERKASDPDSEHRNPESARSDAESPGSDAESPGSDAESPGSDAESPGSDAESLHNSDVEICQDSEPGKEAESQAENRAEKGAGEEGMNLESTYSINWTNLEEGS